MNVEVSSNNVTLNITRLLLVIGMWVIFNRHGESGWKAIIPFYRELIWGRIVGDENSGKKYMIVGIVVFILAIVLAVLVAVLVVITGALDTYYTTGDIDDITYSIGSSTVPPALVFCLGLLLLVVFGLVIYLIVLQYRLGRAHTYMEQAPEGWKWIWTFVPWVAALYFAFMYKGPTDNYEDPQPNDEFGI